jgi:hypothetical protein
VGGLAVALLDHHSCRCHLEVIVEVKGSLMRVTRSALVATLSSAALLVVGLDYTTYAVTGDSLLLGRANHADGVTTLARHASGPALSLESRGHTAPSLRVSSSARVKRLNADLLDGMHAAQLAPRTVSYHAGARGDTVSGGGFWRVKVRPGAYQVTFKAFVIPDAVTPGSSVDVICGVADLNTLGPNTNVYTADSATYDNQFPTLMSGADTVRIKKGAAPGIVCTTSTSTNFTLFKPISASFTRVNHRTVRTASPVPVQRARAQHLFAQLHR